MPGTGAAPTETTTIENRRSSSLRCFTRRAPSFRNEQDPEAADRLGDELGRMVFGG